MATVFPVAAQPNPEGDPREDQTGAAEGIAPGGADARALRTAAEAFILPLYHDSQVDLLPGFWRADHSHTNVIQTLFRGKNDQRVKVLSSKSSLSER